ncbi:MAG: ABC transporter permease [Bacteroidota bacterium]
MLYTLRAEALKLKKSTAGYLVPGILVLLLAGIFLAHTLDVHRLSQLGQDPWPGYLRRAMITYSMLFISPVCVLLVAALLDLEKRANAWSRLYVLPVSRGRIYWSKLLLIVGLVATLTVLFTLGTLLVAALLALRYPEYELAYYLPDLALLVGASVRGFLSALGVIGLQYLAGLFFRGSIPALVLGLFGMVAGFILAATDLSLVRFFPYAYPFIGQEFGPFASVHGKPILLGWNAGVVGSVVWFGACTLVAYWRELRRQVF